MLSKLIEIAKQEDLHELTGLTTRQMQLLFFLLFSSARAQVIRLIGGKLEEDYTEDHKLFEMIKKVNKNVLYMDKIVSDLQLLAKQRSPNLIETCLVELIEGALVNIQVPDMVEFVYGMPHEQVVCVDVDMFERVIVNLVNNAIQAMPDGGKIWFDCVVEDGFDVFCVLDSGIGIAAEDVGSVFTPFYTSKAKGMGLGLSVCKRVVEYHGGVIWVESVEGEGSVFYVKIPSSNGYAIHSNGIETIARADYHL